MSDYLNQIGSKKYATVNHTSAWPDCTEVYACVSLLHSCNLH